MLVLGIQQIDSVIHIYILSYSTLCILIYIMILLGFPSGSSVNNLPANARDIGSIPESGRSTGEGNGNPLDYSCLRNLMDR